MASPGHRANILQPAYREIGFGVIAGNPASRDGGGATFVTEFGVVERAARVRLAPRPRRQRPPRRLARAPRTRAAKRRAARAAPRPAARPPPACPHRARRRARAAAASSAASPRSRAGLR